MSTEQDTRAEDQARAQVESICEMIAAYDEAQENGVVTYEGCEYDEDGMREVMEQDALSVEVRSDWHTPGGAPEPPSAYRILLCTGGPAVQLTGDLTNYREPEDVTVQYQDWFTPWTDYMGTTEEQDAALLRYACMYWFGE